MLPREHEDTAVIACDLREQLEYSRKALHDCVNDYQPPIHLRKEFPRVIKDAALGLHVRVCRKFRQVIMLAESAQADGAELIARSMFEVFLAQAFVCRQSVRLRRRNGGTVNLYGKKLTQQFRAALYFAHDAMQTAKRLDQMAQVTGLKRAAARERKQAAEYIDGWAAEVGPGWEKALKANTCGGVSIEDFAFSFGPGVYKWYRTIYAIQSGYVHPGEPTRFLTHSRRDLETYVRWTDGPHEAHRALWIALAACGLATSEFNRLLDRSHAPYVAARMFDDNYAEMKRVFVM